MSAPESYQAELDYPLLHALIKHEFITRGTPLKDAENSAGFIVKRYREVRALDNQPEDYRKEKGINGT